MKRWILFDLLSVGDYLSSGAVQATIAAMLRRWTQPRRPAVLLSLTEQVPRAVVLGEDELLAAFQGTPIIDLESGSQDARGSLLVFVFDGHETLGYKMVSPHADRSAMDRSRVPLASLTTRTSRCWLGERRASDGTGPGWRSGS